MDPTTRLRRLGILLVFLAALVVLARSRWFNDRLTPVIEAALVRVATFELRDYTSLLDLHGDYSVADLEVDEGDWLADERLGDLELRSSEGVTVLGIYREDGTYLGAPSGEDRIAPGDTVVAYGKQDRLRELVERDAGDEAAHEAARAEFSRTQARGRSRDPERERARPVAE